MNFTMKNLFGQANKGIGKLKGFIFGSQSTEEIKSLQSLIPGKVPKPIIKLSCFGQLKRKIPIQRRFQK